MELPRVERLAGFFFVTLAVLAGYLVTIAPTAPFWDASELIACSYSLGVPHPPGVPLLVLIGRVFSLIPFSSEIAYRVNFISSLTAAICAGLVYLILVMVLASWREVKTLAEKIAIHVSGVTAGLICGYSFTFWFNAVEAEEYAPASLLLIGTLWLALYWQRSYDKPVSKRLLLLIAYLLSLSTGIHLLPILVFPAILIFVLAVNWKEVKDWRLVLAVLAFIVLGVTPNLYLLLRSRLDPGINEVSPTTWRALWDMFGRKQYGAIPVLTNPIIPRRNAAGTDLSNLTAILHQFRTWGRYFSWQYAPFPRAVVGDVTRFLSVGLTSILAFLGVYGLWRGFKNEATKERLPILVALLIVVPVLLLALWFGLWLGGGMGKFALRYAVCLAVLSWPIRWIVRSLRKHSLLLLYMSLFMVSFLLTAYMNLKFCPTDPLAIKNNWPTEVRARDYFYGPSFMLFSLFIGMGIHGCISIFRKKIWHTYGMASLFFLLSLIPLFSNFKSDVNRRGNWIPSDYGYNMLASCDEGGIIFTNGDNDTFPLWFVQEVRGFKKYTGPGKGVMVANLSLLNTSWYIKQIKHRGIPVSFSDWVIDNLYPQPAVKEGRRLQDSLLLVKDLAVRDIVATNAGLKFEPKILGPVLRENLPRKYRRKVPRNQPLLYPSSYMRFLPQEYWVTYPSEYLLPPEEFAQLVLKDYKGDIPIYFATTVSRDNLTGYESHLRLEGLAYRIAPEDGQGMIDLRKTEENLYTVYRYRGILDEKGEPDQVVVKDDNTLKLVSNYAAGFFALGSTYEVRREFEKAIKAYEMGKKFRPGERLPFNYHLSQLYLSVGDLDKAERELLEAKEDRPDEIYTYYLLGEVYRRKGETEKVFENYQKVIDLDPQSPLGWMGLISLYTGTGDQGRLDSLYSEMMKNPQLIGSLVRLYDQRGETTQAMTLLERWLTAHPGDPRAEQLLKSYRLKSPKKPTKARS